MSKQQKYLFGSDARVLVILFENGRVNRSWFREKYNMNYDVAVNSLRFLRDLGITDFDEVGDFRDTQVWFLTEKGKIAAQKLAELVKFIDDTE